jgi:hypothetical protein
MSNVSDYAGGVSGLKGGCLHKRFVIPNSRPDLARVRDLLSNQCEHNREGYVYRAIDKLKAVLTEDHYLFAKIVNNSDEILEAAEYAANLMEANGMVPANDPPSARIPDWRAQPKEERDLVAIRKFAYDQGQTLKDWAQVL